jgi:hypothetical protein
MFPMLQDQETKDHIDYSTVQKLEGSICNIVSMIMHADIT